MRPPPRPIRPGLKPPTEPGAKPWTPPTAMPSDGSLPFVTPLQPVTNAPPPPPLPRDLPKRARTHARPARRLVRSRPTETGTVLTVRELEVLQLAALGLSNEMIAKALFLAIDTIKTHLKRINDKLGTSTRTTAVVAGITLGVIVCPCPRCREAEQAVSGSP